MGSRVEPTQFSKEDTYIECLLKKNHYFFLKWNRVYIWLVKHTVSLSV
jgi:hypothetical protein